jgi:conjugal transfer mating pair stabilization protein TraG
VSLELKDGVTLLGLVPQMVFASIVIERLCEELGVACVVTAGNDGSHSETSEHYAGRALDFRTRELGPAQQQALVSKAQQVLGRDFGVLLEADHLHVHYRPQRPEGGTT